MRAILALSCFIVCIAGGCEHSQRDHSTSELSEQVQALTNRVEELESGREQSSTPNDVRKVQVSSQNANGVFADATHVVAAGHNVLIYFATRNYTSGEPLDATAQLGVYMNYYTAKRLHAALAISVQRHVAVFGEVQPVQAAGQPTTHDKTAMIYANFVRLTGSPEELIVDLGLNPQPVGVPTKPIPIAYTAIMDFPTASTFLRQVGTLIADYEAKNGPIETDVQKRIAN